MHARNLNIKIYYPEIHFTHFLNIPSDQFPKPPEPSDDGHHYDYHSDNGDGPSQPHGRHWPQWSIRGVFVHYSGVMAKGGARATQLETRSSNAPLQYASCLVIGCRGTGR